MPCPSKLRFVQVSDVGLDRSFEHLGGGEVLGEALRKETVAAFARMVGFCTAAPHDLLLLTGSLVDAELSTRSTRLFLDEQFLRLGEAGLEVVLVPDGELDLLRERPFVHVLGPGAPELVLERCCATLVRWSGDSTPNPPRNEGFRFLLGKLPGADPDEASLAGLHAQAEAVRPDYLAFWGSPAKLEVPLQGDRVARCPGSLCQSVFDDPSTHGFFSGVLAGSGLVLTHHLGGGLGLHRRELTLEPTMNGEELASALDRVFEDLPLPAALQVRLTGTRSFRLDPRLTGRTRPSGLYWVDVSDCSRYCLPSDRRSRFLLDHYTHAFEVELSRASGDEVEELERARELGLGLLLEAAEDEEHR
ncbi:MAG: hypothetical protein A2284_08440 [Deltaproteobacteria bacterium RIFOXYA12_FULL_61_11]|nr:MAG: hypothetical protein A2284_08440 [Deltaproteobacteria bacterium RIFOXYA12_FULL_61_11]